MCSLAALDDGLCYVSPDTAGADRMQELSDVFSGATPLSRVEKNENLQGLFSLMWPLCMFMSREPA
jgi:hypothetical protein